MFVSSIVNLLLKKHHHASGLVRAACIMVFGLKRVHNCPRFEALISTYFASQEGG